MSHPAAATALQRAVASASCSPFRASLMHSAWHSAPCSLTSLLHACSSCCVASHSHPDPFHFCIIRKARLVPSQAACSDNNHAPEGARFFAERAHRVVLCSSAVSTLRQLLPLV